MPDKVELSGVRGKKEGRRRTQTNFSREGAQWYCEQ